MKVLRRRQGRFRSQTSCRPWPRTRRTWRSRPVPRSFMRKRISAYKQWRDPVRTTKAYPPHGNKRGEGSLDGFDVAAEGVYEHRSLWESVTSVINGRFFTRHADDGRTYRRKAWQHGVDLFRCLFDQLCRAQYPDPVRDSLGFQHLPSQEQRTSYFCKTLDQRAGDWDERETYSPRTADLLEW